MKVFHKKSILLTLVLTLFWGWLPGQELQIQRPRKNPVIPYTWRDSLIAHYPFSESYVNSVSSVEGEAKGCTIRSNPTRGKVLSLSGENSFFKGDSLDFGKELTYALWVKPSAFKEGAIPVIGIPKVGFLRIALNGELQFSSHQLGWIFSQGAKIRTNEWQHIGVVLSDGKAHFFVNGVSIGEQPLWGMITPQKQPLLIGNDGWDHFFKGEISEVMVWKRALKPIEFQHVIRTTYLEPSLQESLLLWMPLDGSWEGKKMDQVHIKPYKTQWVDDAQKGKVLNLEKGYLEFSSLPIDKAFTFSGFFYPKVLKQKKGAILGGPLLAIRLIQNGGVFFTVPFKKDVFSPQELIKPNEWQHLAISVYPDGAFQFFVNGQKVFQDSLPSLENVERHLWVGKTLWKDRFEGSLCQLGIWSRSLSEQEVRRVYYGALNNLKLEKKELFIHNTTANGEWFLVIVLVLGVMGWIYWMKKKRVEVFSPSVIRPLGIKTNFSEHNFLKVFGGFSLFDAKGRDLATLMPPKIRQLFLILFFYSQKQEHGIEIDELSKLLWPGMAVSQAKNNRNVLMSRLKKLIREVDGLSVSYENNYWRLDMKEPFLSDFNFFFEMSGELEHNSGSPEKARHLSGFSDLRIVPHMEEDWLDEVRAEIVEKAQHILEKGAFLEESLLVYESLANGLLQADPLNEQALRVVLDCRKERKEMVGIKRLWEEFRKVYRESYGEEYPLSLEAFLQEKGG